MNTESKYKVTNKSEFDKRVWINGRWVIVTPNKSFYTDYIEGLDDFEVTEVKEKKRTKEKIAGIITEQ